MFDPQFYLGLVNGAYGSSIDLTKLPGNHPRILRRLEHYLGNCPLPNDAKFNHYRPARYFAENVGSLTDKLSDLELNRFQEAFDALNALLAMNRTP